MINLINRIIKVFTKEKTSDFSVEFYPLTKRYYPKYKRFYLSIDGPTGIIEKLESYLFPYADWGETEDDADKIIALFKEQWMNENVVRIEKGNL